MNALQNCHIGKKAKGKISKDSGLLGCYKVIVSSHLKKNIPRKIQCTINMHVRCVACLTAEGKISMVFLEW